jgi:hypothetical protein
MRFVVAGLTLIASVKPMQIGFPPPPSVGAVAVRPRDRQAAGRIAPGDRRISEGLDEPCFTIGSSS